MGKAQREKGKVSEREVAAVFAAFGWTQAKRSGDAGQADGDLDHIADGFYAEVRRREKLELPAWIREVEEECPDGDTALLIYRRSRMRWRVDLDLEEFLALLRLVPGALPDQTSSSGS